MVIASRSLPPWMLMLMAACVAWQVGCRDRLQPAGAAMSATGTDLSPPPLRIMTYNALKGTHASNIANEIHDSSPDVVLLQEIDSRTARSGREDQVPLLEQHLHMHGFYAASYDDDGGTTGQAILSRFPLQDTKVVSLPRSRNIAAAATIRWNGRDIRLFSAHLSATFQVSYAHVRDSAAARVREAQRLAELASDHNGAVVLGGDLNCGPGSEPYRILKVVLPETSASAPTVPAAAPVFSFDHVFASQHLRCVKSEVLPPGASDHRAVLVELQWVAE